MECKKSSLYSLTESQLRKTLTENTNHKIKFNTKYMDQWIGMPRLSRDKTQYLFPYALLLFVPEKLFNFHIVLHTSETKSIDETFGSENKKAI